VDYARCVAPFAGTGRVLEVGAAAGFTLAGWQQAGWQGVGLEPNVHMTEYAARELDLDVRPTTLEEWEGDGAFDLVSMLQVLPHFVDPHRAIAAATRHLQGKGFLLVETWNRASLLARVMGRRWHEYSPPSVLHWFRPADIERLMNEHGLVSVASGRPHRRLQIGHARSVLRHSLSGSPLRWLTAPLALLPRRLAVPYPGHDLFWMLFQRQG